MEKRRDGQTAEPQLMRRVAKGDERAFDQLYHDYHQLVFNYILRLINEPPQRKNCCRKCIWLYGRGPVDFARRPKSKPG